MKFGLFSYSLFHKSNFGVLVVGLSCVTTVVLSIAYSSNTRNRYLKKHKEEKIKQTELKSQVLTILFPVSRLQFYDHLHKKLSEPCIPLIFLWTYLGRKIKIHKNEKTDSYEVIFRRSDKNYQIPGQLVKNIKKIISTALTTYYKKESSYLEFANEIDGQNWLSLGRKMAIDLENILVSRAEPLYELITHFTLELSEFYNELYTQNNNIKGSMTQSFTLLLSGSVSPENIFQIVFLYLDRFLLEKYLHDVLKVMKEELKNVKNKFELENSLENTHDKEFLTFVLPLNLPTQIKLALKYLDMLNLEASESIYESTELIKSKTSTISVSEIIQKLQN